MNWRAKIWIFRHVRLLLLLGFGLLTVSPLSQARTLKIGDEYGGGIVIALFPVSYTHLTLPTILRV